MQHKGIAQSPNIKGKKGDLLGVEDKPQQLVSFGEATFQENFKNGSFQGDQFNSPPENQSYKPEVEFKQDNSRQSKERSRESQNSNQIRKKFLNSREVEREHRLPAVDTTHIAKGREDSHSPISLHNVSADYALYGNRTYKSSNDKGYDVQSGQQFKRSVRPILSSKSRANPKSQEKLDSSLISSQTYNPTSYKQANSDGKPNKTFLPKINPDSKKQNNANTPHHRARQLSDDRRHQIESGRFNQNGETKESHSFDKYTPRRSTNPNGQPGSNQSSLADNLEQLAPKAPSKNPYSIFNLIAEFRKAPSLPLPKPKVRKMISETYFCKAFFIFINEIS